jgi:hypothetical protein
LHSVLGRPDGRRLSITASSSLYAIDTRVRGAGVAAGLIEIGGPEG